MHIDKKPYISVVIPAYNSAPTLAHTIEACLSQDYPKDKLEILVADDGSLDNTREIVNNFPVKYIYQKRSGPASARNNGWLSSSGEWVCFIDADCVPHRDWVSKLTRHYGAANIGAVAGSYAVDGLQYLLDKFVHYEIKYRHSRMSKYTSSFGTYNVMVKRSVLQELKGFDPVYRHASGEDSDLAYRIIKAGYKIYFEKEALVSHSNILRFWRYLLIQFRHGFWRMKLYTKNSPMIIKDEYAYWKDYLEIFLAFALIFCLLLNVPNQFIISALLVIALFSIQVHLPLKIALEQKDIRYLIFSGVAFIRIFVRIAGGILGFVAFWIIRR